MRKYTTTIIIWASLLIGELHTLWEKCTINQNWIISRKVMMPVQWNIKYATDELWFVLMGLAILWYQDNRINKTTVLAYIAFCIVDFLMYFWNYKQTGYGAIYTFLLIAWILIYNYGSKRSANRQGISYTP